MEKQIIVSKVEQIKSGITNGRAWILYRVTDQNGLTYSTFDATFNGKMGQTVFIDVEEVPGNKINPKTGQPYINRRIVPEKKANPDIQRLEEKIDKILSIVENLTAEDEPGTAEPTEEDIEF